MSTVAIPKKRAAARGRRVRISAPGSGGEAPIVAPLADSTSSVPLAAPSTPIPKLRNSRGPEDEAAGVGFGDVATDLAVNGPISESTMAQAQAVMVAKHMADEAVHNVRADNYVATARAERRMEKLVHQAKTADPNVDPQVAELCRLCNEYKAKYEGKITFQFERKYIPSMGSQALQTHLHHIRMVINVTDVPAHMKSVVKSGADFVETVLKAFGSKYVNPAHLAESIATATDAGAFDEEFDQLAIEWASWFNMPPLQRLLMKLGGIAGMTFLNNAPTARNIAQNASLNRTLDPKMEQETADL